MDEQVLEHIRGGFAMDLYETIKAARKIKDSKIFRHTMMDDGGDNVFAAVFPKKDVMELPGLDENFLDKLKTFNMLGVCVKDEASLDIYHLAGTNKPFTQLQSADDLMKLLDSGPLVAFMQQYFDMRGVAIDLYEMDYEAFMEAVNNEVYSNTAMSDMSRIAELFKN